MGCFTYDCGISQLPIQDDDPVRFLVLSLNPDLLGIRCHPDCAWQVYANPIKARYNSYGSIHKIEDSPATDTFFERLSKFTHERRVGRNPVHDVAVRRDMSREEWLVALWEQRVCSRTPNYAFSVSAVCADSNPNDPRPPKFCPIRQAMVREDVWQLMLARCPSPGLTEVQRVEVAMHHLGKSWYPGTAISPQFIEDKRLSEYHKALLDISLSIEKAAEDEDY